MQHFKAMAVKLLASFALLYIILGLFYGMTFGTVLMISLVLGVISYFLGDLGILPRTNNGVATVADFGLSLAVIWIAISWLTASTNAFTMALISAIGVTVFEYLFHNYIQNMMKNSNTQTTRNNRTNTLQYQTEASEEISPNVSKDPENSKLK